MATPHYATMTTDSGTVVVKLDVSASNDISFSFAWPPKPPKPTVASVWFERAWRKFWTGMPEFAK